MAISWLASRPRQVRLAATLSRPERLLLDLAAAAAADDDRELAIELGLGPSHLLAWLAHCYSLAATQPASQPATLTMMN